MKHIEIMDDRPASSPTSSGPPPIDTEALEHLFAMGDASLREALCAQLGVDLRRLRDAVGAEAAHAVGRAAHELKGLAATVGANPLAEMARGLDAVVAELPSAARAVMVAPLQAEIDRVLAALEAAAGSSSA